VTWKDCLQTDGSRAEHDASRAYGFSPLAQKTLLWIYSANFDTANSQPSYTGPQRRQYLQHEGTQNLNRASILTSQRFPFNEV